MFREVVEDGKPLLSIFIYVVPKSNKSSVMGLHGDELKVKLAALPMDGAANEELVVFFSKFLGLARSRVILAKGHQSKHKTLQISNFTGKMFVERLKEHGIKI